MWKDGTYISLFGFLESTKNVSKIAQPTKTHLLPTTNLTITEGSRGVVPTPTINIEQLIRYYSLTY